MKKQDRQRQEGRVYTKTAKLSFQNTKSREMCNQKTKINKEKQILD